MSAAYLDLPVAQAIFGNDPRAVLAWGPGPTRRRRSRCEGGYKVTGVWAFASGGRHATWLGAHCPIYAGRRLAATRTQRPPARAHHAGARARRSQWTDIWNTVGLRGTASDQFALTDHFVPRRPFDHARRITRVRKECREPGPLYRMSAMTCYEVGFAGVALGIARGALDSFVDVATQQGPARQGEPDPRQCRGADQPRPGRGRHPLGPRLPAAVDGRHLEAASRPATS